MTARGDECDRVLGLELGADDYVVKPFGYASWSPASAPSPRTAARPDDASAADIGPLDIDRRTHRVRRRRRVVADARKSSTCSRCSPRTRRGRPAQQILEEVWDPHWYGPTKTLDVHVASLRKKLGDPRLDRDGARRGLPARAAAREAPPAR